MIERYCTEAMTSLWSREAKYARWLEVEVAICAEYAEAGIIPREDYEAIKAAGSFELARCDELEKETRHDLMAFVRNVSERVSAHAGREPSPSRWIHMGVTSYDVIDTALGMMMRDSCTVLIESAERLIGAINDLDHQHGHHPCIG
ncbi:MAG TPA: lyase family protein, partial [Fimbriimonadaceae bacterium]|nr:lyase family protein [Fimbriimonadaceae bacterium]